MILSSKTKIKVIISVLVILFIAIGGSWAYYKFHVKTPQYAINAVAESIKEHDWNKFNRYVDVDGVVNSISDPLLAGVIEAQGPVPDSTKEVINDFIKMFKSPITTSLKNGIQHYVETGNWNISEESKDQQGALIDPNLILEQTGVANIKLLDLDDVKVNDDNTANAELKVQQEGIDKTFALKITLQRQADGYWKIMSIDNFKEFISFIKEARKAEMEAYIEATDKIYADYSTVEAENENKVSGILAAGTLGDDKTRKELSDAINKDVVPQLQKFKEALDKVKVPNNAKTLQHLRVEILNNKIAYYKAYSQWLMSKDINQLRSATDSLDKAETMQGDAEALLKRIKFQLG